MSANNQLVLGPYPADLDKYAVWMDLCVDNPFDFSTAPLAVVDTLEEAHRVAYMEMTEGVVEYGMRVVLRDTLERYEQQTWDEFQDYKFLAPVLRVRDYVTFPQTGESEEQRRVNRRDPGHVTIPGNGSVDHHWTPYMADHLRDILGWWVRAAEDGSLVLAQREPEGKFNLEHLRIAKEFLKDTSGTF